MKKIIHVNQHIIKYNKKHNTNLPTITVKYGDNNKYCSEVKILGESKVIYSDVPLSCGATVYIETLSDVELINECEYYKIKNEMNNYEQN